MMERTVYSIHAPKCSEKCVDRFELRQTDRILPPLPRGDQSIEAILRGAAPNKWL